MNLYDFIIGLISSLSTIWNWLNNEISILGYTIAPIYLICGGGGAILITVGIVRSLL